MTGEADPLARKAHADLIVARAAEQLRDVLKAAVAAVDPFPPYPGSFFNYGIEVEQPAGLRAGHGCIVVGSDGELYELIMRIDLAADPSDVVGLRDEEMRKLDLSPAEYISLAQAAVNAVTSYLLEKTEGMGYSAT